MNKLFIFYVNVLLQGDMSNGKLTEIQLCYIFIVSKNNKKHHYIVNTISFVGQYDTTYQFVVTT